MAGITKVSSQNWYDSGLNDPSQFEPSFDNGGGVAANGPHSPDAPSVAIDSSGGTQSGSTGSSGTGTTVVTGTTTSPFVISITWDSSVSTAPAGFQTAVIAAATYLESLFTTPVTVNINVGYGEVAGTSLGSGALGESSTNLTSVSYASLLTALQAHNTDATTASVLASLPTTAPVSGTIWVSTAEAKALGLAAANGTASDGSVGFSSTAAMTYNSTTIAAGTYDFNGVALHELTEVLGRITLDGGTVGGLTPSYMFLDLLHYSAPGTRDFSATAPGYFSINGGTTNGGTFNSSGSGDGGDWAGSMGNDAFDAASNAGVVNAFSAADRTEMDALGWTLAPVTPPPAPTGIAITPVTTGLSAEQGTNGLNAGKALLSVVQTGGQAGDSFSYTLGGTGASSFTLNKGTLSTGTTGPTGAAGGKLYALTVTANDTTGGVSSAALPLDIIVGSSGGDTVSVATLVGSTSTATPTFIYGLGGNDTLNGSGMTGSLWFVGGAGADTMTGGTGKNDYLFGANADSTPSAMDVITNFNAAKDMIDLTGIGSTALSYVGAFTGTKIGAYSIGYQTSGGNTLVYVNTSKSAVSLTSASMEIKLSGSIALTSGDFLHH